MSGLSHFEKQYYFLYFALKKGNNLLLRPLATDGHLTESQPIKLSIAFNKVFTGGIHDGERNAILA